MVLVRYLIRSRDNSPVKISNLVSLFNETTAARAGIPMASVAPSIELLYFSIRLTARTLSMISLSSIQFRVSTGKHGRSLLQKVLLGAFLSGTSRPRTSTGCGLFDLLDLGKTSGTEQLQRVPASPGIGSNE